MTSHRMILVSLYDHFASTMSGLENTVSFITGGASGLGEATARYFVKNGGKVVIADVEAVKGQQVADSLGENCLFVETDVTSESKVKAAIAEAKDKFGGINCLVNCAGIAHPMMTYDPFQNCPHSLEVFTRTLEVNATGTFNVIRLVVPEMITNTPYTEDGERGVIINTSSIGAYEGSRALVAYSASKGAVNSMTLPIARDLAMYGIRICTIAPGEFDTPIQAVIPEEVQKQMKAALVFPKRFGHVDEFAQMAESIIKNKMLNGEVIRLDGAFRLPLV